MEINYLYPIAVQKILDLEHHGFITVPTSSLVLVTGGERQNSGGSTGMVNNQVHQPLQLIPALYLKKFTTENSMELSFTSCKTLSTINGKLLSSMTGMIPIQKYQVWK